MIEEPDTLRNLLLLLIITFGGIFISICIGEKRKNITLAVCGIILSALIGVGLIIFSSIEYGIYYDQVLEEIKNTDCSGLVDLYDDYKEDFRDEIMDEMILRCNFGVGGRS